MNISIKSARLWKILGLVSMSVLSTFQSPAADRSTCSGSPSNFSDLQNLSVTATGAGTFHSSVTLAGSRGCAYNVEIYYTGTASGDNPGADYAYAQYTLQDGVFYGSTVYNAYTNTAYPCSAPFAGPSAIGHSGHTMHGQDTIDLYYVDGSGCSGVAANFYNVTILDSYDDSGDIVFDVPSLSADGTSKAHAKVTNPNAFPAGLLVWQINGTTDEETLGCTINPTTGEITAGKVSGKITVRAYCSDTPDSWIEEDLKVGCSTCQNGCTDGSVAVGSVLVSINTGNTAFGDSAGMFQINQSYPSTALSTPAVLKYYTGGLTTNDVTVIRSNGVISQVIAPQVSASVVSNSAYQYQVIFYTNSTLTGTPLTTWTIQNPDGASSSNRLFVAQATGGLTNEYDYAWDGALNGWALTTAGGAKVEKRYNTTNGVLRTETHLILDGSANIKFQETNVYQTFAWGEQQIQNTIGSGSNALVTTWAYYTNAVDTTNYTRLYQVVTPGNHWQRYYYDTTGRVTRQVTQYLDNAIPTSTGQENANRLTLSYFYTDSDGFPTEEIYTYLSGYETAWTKRHYTTGQTQETQEQTAGAFYNSAYDLNTYTVKNLTPPFVGEPSIVLRPDGTMSFYSYALSADGNYQTNTVTTGQPDGGQSYIVDGTKTVTVLSKSGNQILQQTYDIASGLLTSSATTLATDTRGRPTTVQYLDGTTETTVYGCCGIESFTDREGITTTYNYDPYTKQVTSVTRAGITTTYAYDAAGNQTQTTRIGTDSSSITQNVSTFDTAGRLTSSTPADNGSGASQTIAYSEYFDGSNHRVKTTTNPDTSTRVETYYQDGSLLSVTGTGIHPLQYAYGMSTGSGTYGEYARETKTGPNGETTEWSQSYTDPLGRNFLTFFSVASGSNPYNYSYFNTIGQNWAQVDRDGIGTLLAYNAKGQLQDTAVDVNQNSAIDYGGTDRITRSVSDVTTDNGTTVLRTRNYAWATNGVDASNLVSTVETSADGLKTWNITWNNGVGVTNASATFYAGSGNRYVTNTAPDGSYNVAYYQNDLLMSVTSKDLTGSQVAQVSYAYDAHGRQYQVTDARTGTTTYGFNDADQVNSVTTPSPAQTTYSYFDVMGRLWKTTLPDSTSVTNEFYLNGDLKRTYGSRTYPVAYGYDSQGRVTTMTNWSSFASGAGARVTTWKYDGYTGFMTNKVYDGNTAGPGYTFTASGKPKTRSWARGITTTYGYNPAGDLQTVSYSDGTTGITNGFDRLGRQNVVTNGTTVCNFAFNDAGELLSESYSGGILAGLSITNGYDLLLRRTALALASQPSTLVQFGYDAASRLSAVTNGSQTVAYGYLANSPLVQTLTFKQGGMTRLTTTKAYDNLNRLTSISSVPSASSTISFNYNYNNANQRTAMTNADNSHWVYQYDALGQVTSGKKYWDDGTPVAGQQFTYGFDDIGNRTNAASGGDDTGANLRVATYSANNLNQYTSRTVPGYIDILGSANSNATVTVWGTNYLFARAVRHGGFFSMEVPASNTAAAVWLALTNMAVLNNGTNADIIATNVGSKFLVQTPEQFTHDADGNLTSDGRWTNTWNGENRLVSQASLSNAPASSRFKVDYSYDYSGRMIQRIVSTNNGTSFVAYQTNRFVYDGTVQLAELDGTNGLVKSYVRGLDLSGTMQGAGGTGGLLAINAGASGTHFYEIDGNGNVAGLVNATNGIQSASYEYSPFGEMLRGSGFMAFVNAFGFSSQYTDYTTRRVLYLYRPYNPITGGWDSRDPSGEQSGANIYEMLGNSVINSIDLLGKSDFNRPPVGIIPGVPGQSLTVIYPPPSANPLYGNPDAAHYATAIGISIGIGANATYEGALRAAYDTAIRKMQSSYQFLVNEGYMTPEEAARQFVQSRNDLTTATRLRSSAFARTIAAAIKPDTSFKTYEVLRQSKTAEQILNTGAARASANTAGQILKVGGRVCIVAGITFSIIDIAAAPPGQRGAKVAQQAGGTVGALSFGYAGGEIGAVGGPWGAGIGFISGTVIGAIAGSQAGQNYYDVIVNN